MIDHFRDLLTEGEVPECPFDAAIERARKEHNDEKEAKRLAWNNRIMNHYGGEAKLRARMVARRLVRYMRVRGG
jgi:hypothetical protein